MERITPVQKRIFSTKIKSLKSKTITLPAYTKRISSCYEIASAWLIEGVREIYGSCSAHWDDTLEEYVSLVQTNFIKTHFMLFPYKHDFTYEKIIHSPPGKLLERKYGDNTVYTGPSGYIDSVSEDYKTDADSLQAACDNIITAAQYFKHIVEIDAQRFQKNSSVFLLEAFIPGFFNPLLTLQILENVVTRTLTLKKYLAEESSDDEDESGILKPISVSFSKISFSKPSEDLSTEWEEIDGNDYPPTITIDRESTPDKDSDDDYSDDEYPKVCYKTLTPNSLKNYQQPQN